MTTDLSIIAWIGLTGGTNALRLLAWLAGHHINIHDLICESHEIRCSHIVDLLKRCGVKNEMIEILDDD